LEFVIFSPQITRILRPKSKVKQCCQQAFSKLNEIPACAGMTQTARKKQKAARHAIGFLLSWNDDCRAAFSVQPGRFVIPARAGICQIKLEGITTEI
jgi:hypothetical protein